MHLSLSDQFRGTQFFWKIIFCWKAVSFTAFVLVWIILEDKILRVSHFAGLNLFGKFFCWIAVSFTCLWVHLSSSESFYKMRYWGSHISRDSIFLENYFLLKYCQFYSPVDAFVIIWIILKDKILRFNNFAGLDFFEKLFFSEKLSVLHTNL